MLVFPKAHVFVLLFSLSISIIYCKLPEMQLIFMSADDTSLCYQSSDINVLNEAIDENNWKSHFRVASR